MEKFKPASKQKGIVVTFLHGAVDAELFDEWTQSDEPADYDDWLETNLNTQLDILAESTRRLHHITAPILIAAQIVQELERRQSDEYSEDA